MYAYTTATKYGICTFPESSVTLTIDPPPKPTLGTSGILKLVGTPPICRRISRILIMHRQLIYIHIYVYCNIKWNTYYIQYVMLKLLL